MNVILVATCLVMVSLKVVGVAICPIAGPIKGVISSVGDVVCAREDNIARPIHLVSIVTDGC